MARYRGNDGSQLRRVEKLSVVERLGALKCLIISKRPLKLLTTEHLASALRVAGSSDAVQAVQMIINSLSHLSGAKLDWAIDVLLRLGVRLEILSYLLQNSSVFDDEDLCNRLQSILLLIPKSPLEAQNEFYRLRRELESTHLMPPSLAVVEPVPPANIAPPENGPDFEI